MKKITIAFLMLLGTFSMASAELGVNIGIAGSIGEYKVNGFESEGTERNSHSGETAIGALGSVFLEKKLNFLPGPLGRLTVGYDMVMHEVNTGTQSRVDRDLLGISATSANNTTLVNERSKNTVSATLDNINTMYIMFHPVDFLYLKAGLQEMDITTSESLTSGSVYGNASTEGTILAIGVQAQTDAGVFMRFEVNNVEYDNVTIASSTNVDNTVTLNEFDGTAAKFSIGKTF